jgi:hypothetical protein
MHEGLQLTPAGEGHYRGISAIERKRWIRSYKKMDWIIRIEDWIMMRHGLDRSGSAWGWFYDPITSHRSRTSPLILRSVWTLKQLISK